MSTATDTCDHALTGFTLKPSIFWKESDDWKLSTYSDYDKMTFTSELGADANEQAQSSLDNVLSYLESPKFQEKLSTAADNGKKENWGYQTAINAQEKGHPVVPENWAMDNSGRARRLIQRSVESVLNDDLTGLFGMQSIDGKYTKRFPASSDDSAAIPNTSKGGSISIILPNQEMQSSAITSHQDTSSMPPLRDNHVTMSQPETVDPSTDKTEETSKARREDIWGEILTNYKHSQISKAEAVSQMSLLSNQTMQTIDSGLGPSHCDGFMSTLASTAMLPAAA